MQALGKKVYLWIIKRLSEYSPTIATKVLYFRYFHRFLDLNNPHTLNEKILWLKLNTYKDNPLVTQCADKYRVREYVEKCGCGSILNELYYVWDNVTEIDWNALPDQFVMKCNHGCGYNIICSNKGNLDQKKTVQQLDQWMKEDFWKQKAEINYKNISKKIICEKYLNCNNEERLSDYKVYCFHGVAAYILYCQEVKRKFYFFDRQWQLQRINKDSKECMNEIPVQAPKCLQQLLEYAEQLSRPFPFVRVDFYVQNEIIIFGEMTFTPSAGFDTARLPKTDIMFGDMLNLK